MEQELKKLEPVIRALSRLSLLGKKVLMHGEDNFIKSGPNIIVGNHCGSYKDVAVIFSIVPRPVFFTANKEIFDREEFNRLVRRHLRRHLKDFGLTLDRLLGPVKKVFVDFISTNITKIGTIPVNLNLQVKKGEAITLCQDLVRTGRALIALQGRGRVKKKAHHPYVDTFRRGASFIAYSLYAQDGLSVPVTPVAIFGTQVPLFIPGKVRVNVGSPMYARDYLSSGIMESVERFRTALEARVKSLFLELIRMK